MDGDADELMQDAATGMDALEDEIDLGDTVFKLEMTQAKLLSMESSFGTMLKWFGVVALIGFAVVVATVVACIWTRLGLDASHAHDVDEIAIPVGSAAALVVGFCLFKAIEIGAMKVKLKAERVGVELAVIRGRRLLKEEPTKEDAA